MPGQASAESHEGEGACMRSAMGCWVPYKRALSILVGAALVLAVSAADAIAQTTPPQLAEVDFAISNVKPGTGDVDIVYSTGVDDSGGGLVNLQAGAASAFGVFSDEWDLTRREAPR
jgi:hypothetical protein